MIQTTNLAGIISKRLPLELADFLQQAGRTATRLGQKLYLAGGVVRDLLLERNNLDLDLVADGDAIQIAEELARLKNGKVIAHSRFSTAKIKWDKWSVDIATTRSECYTRPGALPDVQCKCGIEDDLIRRDFTINAMAIHLDPLRYGDIIDLYNGRDDLKRGYIRILHNNSFRDDATRIWRAVRYEQRLSFHIEHHTLDLIKRDISYLDAISGDRIRHELELCLEEDRPERVLLRADDLGILARMCPPLKMDSRVMKKMTKARGIMQPYSPPKEVLLALLIYQLTPPDLANLVTYLKFPRSTARDLEDTLKLKEDTGCLAAPEMTPSRIYRCLNPYSQTAILANLISTDNPLVRERIELYLSKLRYIRTSLTGDDLIAMGIKPGPGIKEVLEQLKGARLDGSISTLQEEVETVKNMVRAEQ